MKMYVFDRVESLTHHYHASGGLAVAAADKRAARNLVAERLRDRDGDDDGYEPAGPTEEEWSAATVYRLDGNPKPRVFVFPDSGCC